MKPITPYPVLRYQTSDGKIPFSTWMSGLDTNTASKIEGRLLRVERGLLGDCRSLGDGVIEFKIDLGPGYRVYFSYVNGAVILLLVGGDKSTQKKDIKLAQKYLKDYKERTK